MLVVGTEQTHFGGEWIIGGFEAKTLAYGVLLHALRAWLDRRWTLAWTLIGLTTAMHALVGGWAGLAMLLAWATGSPRRPALRAMIPGLLIGAGLGSAGVAPPLVMNAAAPAELTTEANKIYVFERIAHHLAPLSKPWGWLRPRLTWHTVMLLLLAAMSVTLLSGPRRRVARRASLRFITRFAWGAALIAATGLLIELVLWDHPAMAASILKYYWFRLTDIAAPLAGSLILSAAVGYGLRSESVRTRLGATAGAALLFALCCWGVGGHAINRLEKPIAPADRKLPDAAAWVEACAWIEANLPEDAVLITPRLGASFKWRAQRVEVATYKDIPQDALSMVEWRRRYRDIYQIGSWKSGKPRWTPSVASLGAERLVDLGAKYGATHALSCTPRGEPSGADRASLPVVQRWGPYTLYALPRPAQRPQPENPP